MSYIAKTTHLLYNKLREEAIIIICKRRKKIVEKEDLVDTLRVIDCL